MSDNIAGASTSGAPDLPRPDAIMVPFHWGAGAGDQMERHKGFKGDFGPTFGTEHVATSKQVMGYYVTPGKASDGPQPSLLFPLDHPLAKQARYVWVAQDTFNGKPSAGLSFGYLKAEAQ